MEQVGSDRQSNIVSFQRLVKKTNCLFSQLDNLMIFITKTLFMKLSALPGQMKLQKIISLYRKCDNSFE